MIPTIPTFSLLEGPEGTAKGAPGSGACADLFSLLVARVVGAPSPSSSPSLAAAALYGEPAASVGSDLSIDQSPGGLEGGPEPDGEAVSGRPVDEPALPQAALLAVLAAQPPSTPSVAATAAAPALPTLKAVTLPQPASAKSLGTVAIPVAEKPDAPLSGIAMAPVPEPVRAARGPDQPIGPAAHAVVPKETPAAPATAVRTEAPAAHATATLDRPLPGFQLVFPEPAPVAEMRAEAPDRTSFPLPVEQGVEQQLDLAHESEWLDSLTRDIVRLADGGGALRFRLHPESLGSLAVEISQGAAGASVRLTADSEAARTIIADAQPRLMAEARAQGVRIAETHVDLGSGGHAAPEDRRGQHGPSEEILLRTAGGDAADTEASPPVRGVAERYA